VKHSLSPGQLLFFSLLFLGGLNTSLAGTLYVNTHGTAHPRGTLHRGIASIQAAIDIAKDGDTIVVEPGTYHETIHFQGKNITLRSTDPHDWSVVDATIIDASGEGSVVTFSGTETDDCLLSGFKITGGSAEGGGGINGNGTLATIRFNRVVRNRSFEIVVFSGSRIGGAIYKCNGTLSNNLVVHNSGDFLGYGAISSCAGQIRNSLIAHNDGYGIYEFDGLIINNTVVGVIFSANGLIVNCIVWEETTDSIEGSWTINSCVQARFRNIQGRGLVYEDPLFVDALNSDFRLSAESPCRNIGMNGFSFGSYIADASGFGRICENVVDLGCYEYGSSPDSDGDYLADTLEEINGTNPLVQDSDSDGLGDGLEVLRGNDPKFPDSPTGITVPGDFESVSDATFLAYTGENITVLPGTYTENIVITRDISLGSIDPTDPEIVASTIIDGSRTWSVITMSGKESSDCVVDGLTITNGFNIGGGGFLGNGTRATIRRNHIVANCASAGFPGLSHQGGGLVDCDGLIESNLVTQNKAHQGAGIFGCDGLIRDNTITLNESFREIFHRSYRNGKGAGIAECGAVITNNIISKNETKGFGAGLADCSGPIVANIISNNTSCGSSFGGGGIFRCNGWITMNVIAENLAVYGGGLSHCDALIEANEIRQNQAIGGRNGFLRADGLGGGFYKCDGIIKGNIISENRASDGCHVNEGTWPRCGDALGGALYGCDGVIQNNLIRQNSCLHECLSHADNRGTIRSDCGLSSGGAMTNCQGDIQNNTIVDNFTETLGGGITDCEGTVGNNIIWMNEAPEDAQVANTTPTYCCIQDWTGGGEGNISDDPLFFDPENENFRITSDSLCVDAGQFVEGLVIDFDGNPRPIDGVSIPRGDGSDIDMGAFEYQLFKNVAADILQDLKINELDLFSLQPHWYQEGNRAKGSDWEKLPFIKNTLP